MVPGVDGRSGEVVRLPDGGLGVAVVNGAVRPGSALIEGDRLTFGDAAQRWLGARFT
jgi:hypothetical protein